MMSPLPDVFAEAARAEVHSLHQICPTGITFNAGPPVEIGMQKGPTSGVEIGA